MINDWYCLGDIIWIHGNDFPQPFIDPSVGQSSPGRSPADDTMFESIANFLIPESLTFFNKSSPGYVLVLSAAVPRDHYRHVSELDSLSYIHVYKWEDGQKVKQAHHTSVPSDCVTVCASSYNLQMDSYTCVMIIVVVVSFISNKIQQWNNTE